MWCFSFSVIASLKVGVNEEGLTRLQPTCTNINRVHMAPPPTAAREEANGQANGCCFTLIVKSALKAPPIIIAFVWF